jgi:hypothetical protein
VGFSTRSCQRLTGRCDPSPRETDGGPPQSTRYTLQSRHWPRPWTIDRSQAGAASWRPLLGSHKITWFTGNPSWSPTLLGCDFLKPGIV